MPESFSKHCEHTFESTMNGADQVLLFERHTTQNNNLPQTCQKLLKNAKIIAKNGKIKPEIFSTHCKHTFESTMNGADQVL